MTECVTAEKHNYQGYATERVAHDGRRFDSFELR
jgi:hypothetical protein